MLERQANCSQHEMWHEPLPKTIEWMRCGRCSHSHTRHFWTPQGLVEVFSKGSDNQTAGTGQDPDSLRQFWSVQVHSAIEHLGGFRGILKAAERPIWLDVGCGAGGLALTAKEMGFAEVALDTRKATVDRLKAMGCNAVLGDFLSVSLGRKAAVVSMMDVLEHIAYPVYALRHARSLLSDEGVLILSLPNEDSWSWKVADIVDESPYWRELEHHHNFGLLRLCALLEAEGFNVASAHIVSRYRSQVEIYAKPAP